MNIVMFMVRDMVSTQLRRWLADTWSRRNSKATTVRSDEESISWRAESSSQSEHLATHSIIHSDTFLLDSGASDHMEGKKN